MLIYESVRVGKGFSKCRRLVIRSNNEGVQKDGTEEVTGDEECMQRVYKEE